MIVDELVTLLKFDAAGISKAEAFDKVLSGIEEHAEAVILGLTGAIASVGYFADRVSKSIAQNYEWAKSVGVASDSYQKFDHAAAIVGGSLDDIKSDLEGWVRSAKASGQTLEEIFLGEAKSIEGMTTEQSQAFLRARGYSETSIRMIQQGEGKLKEFLAQAEVIPEQNLQAAEDYAKTWRQVSSEVSQLMTAAVATALPALRSVLDIIRSFVQRNKELVKGTVSAFFKSVAIALKMVSAALSPLIWGIEFVIKMFDILTFGAGKYILIIGLLTAAFSALAIAAGIKTVKGVANLMGQFSNMIAIAAKAVDYITQLVFQVETLGFKQAFLNSELSAGVKLWWKNLAANAMALKTSVARLAVAVKELFVQRILTAEMKKSILYQKIKTALNYIHTASIFLMNKALQINIFWNRLLEIYHKKGALAAAKYAGVLVGRLLVAIVRSTFALIKFCSVMTVKMLPALARAIVASGKFAAVLMLSLVKALIKVIPLIFAFAAGLIGTVVPALISAAAAAWSFTAALLANPITWIIAAIIVGIAAIAAGIYAIIKYWKEIDEFLDSFSAWFNSADGWVSKLLKGILKGLTIILGPVGQIAAYWNDIKSAISWCSSKLSKVASWFGGGKESGNVAGGINSVLEATAPANTVASPSTISAQASPNQISNNRSTSYIDQRNITINTNATSGPAMANYLRGTNSMMAAGMGMAGAY